MILELNNLASLNLYVTMMPPIVSAQSVTLREEMWFEEFQDGHLEYWNRKILGIPNSHNTPMPPIKFKVNQIYGLGADMI